MLRRAALALALASCASGASRETPPPDAGNLPSDSADAGSSAPDAGSDEPPPLAGTFVDLTASVESPPPFTFPPTGSPEPPPSAGGFADLDGDGVDEVLLASRQGTLAYDLDGERLVPFRESSSDVVLAMDLDEDGHVDLLYAGGPTPLAWGNPDGSFSADSLGLAQRDAISFGAVDDLDGDGWLDLVAGADCCRAEAACTSFLPLLRTGPRTFEPRPDLVQAGPRGRPTGLFVWSSRPGELGVAALGDACVQGGDPPPVFFRSPLGEEPHFTPFDPLPRDAFFRRGLPPSDRGYPFSVHVPMGGAVADLDGDGLTDLAITVDPEHAFFGGHGDGWLLDHTPQVAFAQLRTPTGRFYKGWGVALVDVDQDGREDVVTAHGNDVAGFTDPLVDMGPVPTTLHLNRGDWSFSEASRALGLGRPGQWKSVAVGDLDRDGDPDFVVGGQGELPRAYRNELRTGGHGFSLRLHGTTSNAVGAGARVWVTPEGLERAQLHEVRGAGSPFWIAEPLVFAGLGRAERAQVRIEWPSGVEQRLSLEAGRRHDVTEPEVLAIAPENRHLPADGQAQAVVTIAPRDAAGNVAAGRQVTVAIAGTPAIPADPESQPDGSVVVRIRAPLVAGESRVNVSIDGKPLGVRPRLWWTAP